MALTKVIILLLNQLEDMTPLLLKLTDVPSLLWQDPLSTFVSVGSALGGLRNEPKGLRSRQRGRVGSTPRPSRVRGQETPAARDGADIQEAA